MLLFDVEIFLFVTEFALNNTSLFSAAALIYPEVPATDTSGGQIKSCIEFTVKETSEKVINDFSFILYFAIQLAGWRI